MGLHRMQRTRCLREQVRLFHGVCWQLMECMRRGTCSVVSLPETCNIKDWRGKIWKDCFDSPGCGVFHLCCRFLLDCPGLHVLACLKEFCRRSASSSVVLPPGADLTPVSFPFPRLVSVTARRQCGGYCLSKGMKVAFNVTQGEKASWTDVKCAIWYRKSFTVSKGFHRKRQRWVTSLIQNDESFSSSAWKHQVSLNLPQSLVFLQVPQTSWGLWTFYILLRFFRVPVV